MRFCLECSAGSGRLVGRRAPALERKRAAKVAARIDKQQRGRERERERERKAAASVVPVIDAVGQEFFLDAVELLAGGKLYPDCGCPPDRYSPRDGRVTTNVVCRNGDCASYGTHRRGFVGDRCPFCGTTFVLLRKDVFRGAR